MSEKTLALIHTSATLVPVFQQLCNAHLPGVKTFNIVDDSLIKDVIRAGELTPATARRVSMYIASAQDAGADQILVTCSSIGRAVEASAAFSQIPVLRVDQPMADQAVVQGKKVGVIATLATTLDPTSDLVRRRAAALHQEVQISSVLCEGAFEALMSGDSHRHDQMVAKALKELSQSVDVILLAQASMARVVDTLEPEEKIVPILASPEIAIKYLATIL